MLDRVVTIVNETGAVSLFLAVMILLLSAILCGKLVTLVKLPKVVGEILGGFIIGPSVFGRLFPGLYEGLFLEPAGQGTALSVFYWLGLVFLMFSAGYETDFKDIKSDAKIIGWLIGGATIPPFILGYLISDRFFADYYLGAAGNRLVFNIIFAIAASVTSLPVISKIFMDLGLIRHRFARIILATATLQDLFLWIILSVATSIITNDAVVYSSIVLHIVITLTMFVFAMLVMPRVQKLRITDKFPFMAYDSFIFAVCFFFIYIGGLFNVNIMYSAFVAGMVYKNARREDAVASQTKLKDLCLAFFTPVYFAIVGLRLYLTSDFSLSRFLTFLSIAFALEIIGCMIAMKCIRLDWLTCLNFGVAMNARGGPGIVLASVAFDLGVINYEFFCVLVFTVLITSAMAGYWIGFVNKKGKLLS